MKPKAKQIKQKTNTKYEKEEGNEDHMCDGHLFFLPLFQHT